MLPTSELRGGLQRNQDGSFAASLCPFLLAEERASTCFRRGGGGLPQSAYADSSLQEGAISPNPAACSATRQSEQSSVAVEGDAARTGDHGADCLEHVCCELTEPPRTNSRREFTSAVVPYRLLHRNFVEDRKGTKTVPLPLLCAPFFSQKKGQSPSIAGAAVLFAGAVVCERLIRFHDKSRPASGKLFPSAGFFVKTLFSPYSFRKSVDK